MFLPSRGSLLAFTDGLFERRDEMLDTSLDELVARVGAWAGHAVADLADALLDGATADHRWADDMGARDPWLVILVRSGPRRDSRPT